MMKILTTITVLAFVLGGSSMMAFAQTRAEVDVQAEPNQSEDARERDTDSDDDGLEDLTEEREDLPDFLDDDDDNDTVPTALPVKEVDKATPRLIETRAQGDDKATPLLYQGLQVRGELCDEGGDCDDRDDDVKPGEAKGRLWINVSGSEARGMSAEAKAQVQERLRAMGEDANTANDFGLRVANAALENDAISEIVTNDEETEVRYKTRLRLFGFIPVNTTAVARASAEGDVNVTYPWYRFLSRVQDDETMTDLALELRTTHNTLIANDEAEDDSIAQ